MLGEYMLLCPINELSQAREAGPQVAVCPPPARSLASNARG